MNYRYFTRESSGKTINPLNISDCGFTKVSLLLFFSLDYWWSGTHFSTGRNRRCTCLVCVYRFLSLSFQRPPSHVASKVLPEALQSPDHMHLAVRKVFEETVGDQSGNILPIVISFVGQFFLQHRADGNHCGKPIPKDHELKKECPA